jgi:flavin prenyltransferase
MERIVVGISGSSGIILGLKAIRILIEEGFWVELIVSKAAFLVATQELGKDYGNLDKLLNHFTSEEQTKIAAHSFQDFCAGAASGSFITKAMIVIPCSMTTLSGIAHGMGDNLLRRAADVCLKEKRPLVIVPRETPFSQIHLENMLKLSKMGVSIVPPVPAWYNGSTSIEDVEDFVVGRVLDQIGVHSKSYARWGS